MEKLKVSAAVVGLFAAGAFFGGYAAFTQIRVNGLNAAVEQLAADQKAMLNDLNTKVLPQIQKELADVKAGKK